MPLALPDFSIDWQRMAEAIGPRTRLVIINTRTTQRRADQPRGTGRLAALIRDRDIYLISDEVYEHLVFDGVAHTSVLSHDELYPRSFVVSSFGEDLPRHRLEDRLRGRACAQRELRKVHQYVNFCGVTPLQWALADYMAGHPEHLRQLPGFYQAKRDLFCDLLLDSLPFHPCAGHLLPVRGLFGRPSGPGRRGHGRGLTREHGSGGDPGFGVL